MTKLWSYCDSRFQGRSQPFLTEGSKLFSKSWLYTAMQIQISGTSWEKELATLYNKRHLAYDYSHCTVKIKLVTTCAS